MLEDEGRAVRCVRVLLRVRPQPEINCASPFPHPISNVLPLLPCRSDSTRWYLTGLRIILQNSRESRVTRRTELDQHAKDIVAKGNTGGIAQGSAGSAVKDLGAADC